MPEIESQVEEAMALPYTRITRIWEDGGYAAEVLELPGCFASGDTAEEAAQHLEDEMRAWIAGEMEDGHDIPPPAASAYSGQLNLRLGPRLHERAAGLAQAEGISLNRWLTTAIATYAGERVQPSLRALTPGAAGTAEKNAPSRRVSDPGSGPYASG